MDARLQRRVQRYGWDLAAEQYESLWRTQLAPAQRALLDEAALGTGERVLDVACGTGLVTFAAARAVGPTGTVIGIDLSAAMVSHARQRANAEGLQQARFERMDAEQIEGPDARFDAALCALGLMYMPNPEHALRVMRRALRPGGRIALAIWGERARCAWAAVFPIVDAEVASEVCPLFFRFGQADALARACAEAGFEQVMSRRIATTLHFENAEQACQAVFVGGPVTLAWSHFDAATRARVEARYLAAIGPWKCGDGYALPGEFVLVSARVPA